MAGRNLALNIAFRTLVGTLALLSLAVLIIQRVPALRTHPQVAAWWKTPAAETEADAGESNNREAASAMSASDPFSGSVTENNLSEEPRSPVALAPTPIARLDTFELPARAEAPLPDSALQPEPAPPVAEPIPSPSLAEWEEARQRLSNLEQRADALEERPIQSAPFADDRLAQRLEQLETQTLEVQAVLGRLDDLERQVQTLREEQQVVKAEPEATTRAEPSSSAERIVLRATDADGRRKLDIEAREASLAELIARLGQAAELNLIVSPSVTGAVSLHWQQADAHEALESICRLHQCRTEQNNGFLTVTREPAAPPAPVEKAPPPETLTKLYKLQHLTGSEIRPYVAPLLTPGVGTVSFASVRERVSRTGYRQPPRAILVKDTPEKLVEVERLLAELDRPSTKTTAVHPVRQQVPAATTPAAIAAPPATTAPPPQLAPPAVYQQTSRPVLPAPACEDCEVFEPPLELPAINRR